MVTGSGRATDTTTSGAARSTVTENSGNANRSPARTGESDLHSPIADNRTAARNDIITDTRHPTQNQTVSFAVNMRGTVKHGRKK